VHETVRQDILGDDIRKEGRTLRRDLLGPLTRFRFGPDIPVPYFRRKLKQPREVTDVAAMLDVAVNRLGVDVPAGWALDALGIPQGAEGESILRGAPR
jgi:phage gp29-like protein